MGDTFFVDKKYEFYFSIIKYILQLLKNEVLVMNMMIKGFIKGVMIEVMVIVWCFFSYIIMKV